MRRLVTGTLAVASCLCAGSAAAITPTLDALQLTQHAQTSSSTVQLVPVASKRQDADSQVHCAVTTGRKASVIDPAVRPQSGAGSRMIQPYAPDMPATPAPTAQGAALNSQTLFKTTGDVTAGLEASFASTTAAIEAFRVASRQVGTTTTVMAAVDMNSGARLQNGLAWNSVIGSTNLWVQAVNALNLATTSDASRLATAMRFSGPSASVRDLAPAAAQPTDR